MYSPFSCVSHTQDELREEVKEKLKWSVNRDTPEDKLIDFLQWMEAARRDIDHQVSTCACVMKFASTCCKDRHRVLEQMWAWYTCTAKDRRLGVHIHSQGTFFSNQNNQRGRDGQPNKHV